MVSVSLSTGGLLIGRWVCVGPVSTSSSAGDTQERDRLGNKEARPLAVRL